ncbi:GNAT family N-acetyltransferase [Nocardia sp. SYP-A9097]|uniref:GNAT family N-acetyltransferase n=1 Tax=Nocardia sp. SYP-A9097 TaxID=2663237 RepID=UPI00129AB760|nr:GNAT family N-acetyltransferase [Nocardia sp. SYP-A9097]MRH92672.1 GNAT family N-acetyltransferase [Nocardia sp. SYP-A9097]
MRIRAATTDDLPTMQCIEDATGEPFRTIGMIEIADDEAPSLELLDEHRRAGRAWVAVDDSDTPIAYLISEEVDGTEHIEQVSVHPNAGRQGIGRRLIETAAEHARGQGLSALTLTTFTEVPWNAPYYARIGFHVIDDEELTPGLRKIRAHEAELGLDRWPRTAMRREL